MPYVPIPRDSSPADAARRLGLSRPTIWRMMADGSLPYYVLRPDAPRATRRVRHEAITAIRRGACPHEAIRRADEALDARLARTSQVA